MADTAATKAGDETLEQQLEEMLDIEKFDPPESFRKHALLNDPKVYEEAEADWKGWWAKQAKELHWFREPTEVLTDSNPPVYQWREEGEPRAYTYPDLHRAVQRFPVALKDVGFNRGDVGGSYLPMITKVVVAM